MVKTGYCPIDIEELVLHKSATYIKMNNLPVSITIPRGSIYRTKEIYRT